MKNRSKELGIYGMLGLEKRHLISMTFKELVVFGILTVGAGIGIGALFDKLIFAFPLKLMKLKVELVATFQMNVVIAVLVVFGLIFLGLMFLNALRIARMNALQLLVKKLVVRKRSFPTSTNYSCFHKFRDWLLSCPYCKDPLTALTTFFLAVLLVIFGTYLLFNAGITVFLQILKKNKKYYYQPNNLISVSNLIFRMKKNAVGLATIAILSTMVLVTMFCSDKHFQCLRIL